MCSLSGTDEVTIGRFGELPHTFELQFCETYNIVLALFYYVHSTYRQEIVSPLPISLP